MRNQDENNQRRELNRETEFTDTERFEWVIETHAIVFKDPFGYLIDADGFRGTRSYRSAREAVDDGMRELGKNAQIRRTGT
jgi:hypothetical protein